MIVFSVRIVTPDQARPALLRGLGALLAPTRVLPGCLDARLYAEVADRKALVLVEEWETRELFDQGLDSDKLDALVAAIESSSEAPIVRVDSVEREEGIDSLRPTAGGRRT